jgi:hypothetical protein
MPDDIYVHKATQRVFLLNSDTETFGVLLTQRSEEESLKACVKIAYNFKVVTPGQQTA